MTEIAVQTLTDLQHVLETESRTMSLSLVITHVGLIALVAITMIISLPSIHI